MITHSSSKSASSFSELLKKYYSRQGNKIVFCNGMTLNRLALAMWEKLNYSQIDPSVLSKIVSGKRLFSATQLKIFLSTIDASQDLPLLTSYLRNAALQQLGFDEVDECNNQNKLINHLHGTVVNLYLNGHCNEIAVLTQTPITIQLSQLSTPSLVNKAILILFIFGWAKNCRYQNPDGQASIEQNVLTKYAKVFNNQSAQAYANLLSGLDSFAQAEYFFHNTTSAYEATLNSCVSALPHLHSTIIPLALRNIILSAAALQKPLPNEAAKSISRLESLTNIVPNYNWTLLNSAIIRSNLKLPNLRTTNLPEIPNSAGIYFVSAQKDLLQTKNICNIPHKPKIELALALAQSHQWMRQANKLAALTQ